MSFSWAWGLKLVILAIQEVKIGRTMVWAQPRQKFHKTPAQPMAGCLSSQLCKKGTNRRIVVQVGPGIKQEPISEITNTEKDGGLAQVIECLPSKRKALNSTPVTTRKKMSFRWLISNYGFVCVFGIEPRASCSLHLVGCSPIFLVRVIYSIKNLHNSL
jgi:hypothetical protein